MKWVKMEQGLRIPIKSWCEDTEPGAMVQAENLAKHPVLAHHVALMPDCHQGYGMPIGGVIAAKDAIIPAAVGVDIGCGMIAVETDVPAERLARNSLTPQDVPRARAKAGHYICTLRVSATAST